MTHIIRAIAVGAAMAVLAFAPAQSSARGCGDDKERTGCQTTAPASPVQLDQFMKTWKPASVSTSGKRTRSAWRSHRSRSHSQMASSHKSTSESKIASEPKESTEAKIAAAEPTPAAEQTTPTTASPFPAFETDGVAVTSYSEANELDQAAPRIQVVAFNEINEIDLAAPLPAVTETVSQALASTPEPTDNSWIGKLLLAVAGILALAGGVRLLAV